MPVTFEHRRLDNGLHLAVEQHPDAHTSAVGFFVRTGTRDEDKPLEGVSHFLEHMMFKGTDRRTADDVNREFDEIGANYNAFTSHEQTVYYAHVLPEFLPRAVDLLGDMLRPALREDDFAMEKNVILEEIGMYEDRPYWRLYESLMERHFGDHPLGYRVLGTNESIRALTADRMRDYFTRRYSPDNIVVAAAGRIDVDAFEADVRRAAEAWEPSGTRRHYGEVSHHAGDHRVDDARVQRGYLGLIWPGPSAQDDQRYAATVLANLLGDDEGSRLYWALVDQGLADEADLAYNPMDRAGYFAAYATCNPDRLDRVEAVLREAVAAVAGDLSAEEVTRSANKIATAATLRGESPLGRMMGVGRRWVYLDSYAPLDEEIERILAVDVAQVQSVLRDWPFDRITAMRLQPQRD